MWKEVNNDVTGVSMAKGMITFESARFDQTKNVHAKLFEVFWEDELTGWV